MVCLPYFDKSSWNKAPQRWTPWWVTQEWYRRGARWPHWTDSADKPPYPKGLKCGVVCITSQPSRAQPGVALQDCSPNSTKTLPSPPPPPGGAVTASELEPRLGPWGSPPSSLGVKEEGAARGNPLGHQNTYGPQFPEAKADSTLFRPQGSTVSRAHDCRIKAGEGISSRASSLRSCIWLRQLLSYHGCRAQAFGQRDSGGIVPGVFIT